MYERVGFNKIINGKCQGYARTILSSIGNIDFLRNYLLFWLFCVFVRFVARCWCEFGAVEYVYFWSCLYVTIDAIFRVRMNFYCSLFIYKGKKLSDTNIETLECRSEMNISFYVD